MLFIIRIKDTVIIDHHAKRTIYAYNNSLLFEATEVTGTISIANGTLGVL